ncbi:MAG TPA: cation transporter [Candidatus Faecalibacterium faecigallinarum]|uniref:Cation transporter n=1 Tax=Candidatus Faecalibacterium faecigallinarum TaxID=2838577 RepID=A0A9D2T432_9FIRM|nr:cation transporter [Candidatus Faecalibacterium faecigallinarum]
MYKTTAKIDGMACSMCEAHVNETVRRAFPVKKVTSSHKKGECVILAEEPVGQAELAAALDPTGYKVLSAESESYRKKGLFGF